VWTYMKTSFELIKNDLPPAAPNLSIAYSSQYDEITLENLRIDGEVPTWLSGSFVSNGPGQFEVGTTHFYTV